MIVRTRPLTTDEARRYVMALREAPAKEWPYTAIAALAIGTGARIGEVLAMRNGDVLTDQGRIRDKVRRKVEKKRGQVIYRETPFCIPALWRLVQRYADTYPRQSAFLPADGQFFCLRWCGAPVNYLTAWRHNRLFLAAAGIDPAGVAFHGLRKTFLTAVFRDIYGKTGDMLKALTAVKSLAGHESINTTIAYLDIREVDEERTIRSAMSEIVKEKSQI